MAYYCGNCRYFEADEEGSNKGYCTKWSSGSVVYSNDYAPETEDGELECYQ